MKSQAQTVTTLVDSPTDERRRRMIKYTLAMSVRMVCIVLMLFVDGWLLVVCAAGAIFLPYFAVILANAVSSPRQGFIDVPSVALEKSEQREH